MSHQAVVCTRQGIFMGFVSRFRIGTRLAMGFGLMLLLIAGMIVSSYGALQRIGAENSQLIDQELVKVSAVAVIDTTTRANGLNTTELLLVEPAQLPVIQARMQQNRLAIDEALKTLDRLVVLPQGRAALSELQTARAAYVASFAKIAPLVQAGQIDEARQLVHKETLPALGRLQQPIDTLRQLQDTLAQQHGAAVTAGITSARNLMLVLGGAALVLAAATGVMAQESTNQVAVMTDWSVFSEPSDGKPKECWGVTVPKETVNTRDGQPVSVRRGDILLFVTFRPGKPGEISFTGGYPFAGGSTVDVAIDGNSFQLFTDGEWAWPASAEADGALLTAMKRGATAVITGASGRGTQTRDTFSLRGFTAAMTEAATTTAATGAARRRLTTPGRNRRASRLTPAIDTRMTAR